MPTFTQLFLVRHGQSTCNRRGVLCGAACEAELTGEGRRTAANVAREAKNSPPARIIASPMVRARQTAAPLAEAFRVTVELDPAWREIEYGSWEGRDPERLASEQAEVWAGFRKTPAAVGPPGGETVAAVAARVSGALDALRGSPSPVWIVSHKTTLRVAACLLAGIPLDDYRRRISMETGQIIPVTLGPPDHLDGAITAPQVLPP